MAVLTTGTVGDYKHMYTVWETRKVNLDLVKPLN